MSLLNSLIGPVTGILDKVIEDKDQKAKLAHELATMADKLSHEQQLAQIEVNKVEANSNSLFVAGWRPFVGWTCGIALCYHFVLQPFLVFLLYSFGYQVALPVFDMTTLTTILLGMLGLGGMRSLEKVKKSA